VEPARGGASTLREIYFEEVEPACGGASTLRKIYFEEGEPARGGASVHKEGNKKEHRKKTKS
jgi:hypothetical protein